MEYKSITQIILVITSLVIIFTYIRPAFVDIESIQDEIFKYSNASDKAHELNNLLKHLIKTEQSFLNKDLIALSSYLPDNIDDMRVMSDIANIVEQSAMKMISLNSGELTSPTEDVFFEGEPVVSDGTTHLDFNLEVSGSYSGLKSLLRLLEQNKYPLEIIELSLGNSSQESSGPTSVTVQRDREMYTIVLRTYSYSRISN